MSESSFKQTIVSFHQYLETSIPTPVDFRRRGNDFVDRLASLRSLDEPYFSLIQDGSSWLFILIGTYYVGGKKVCLDLVAYLDSPVVRFLRNWSDLRFKDSIPECTDMSVQEKVEHYMSERYSLSFANLLHPGGGKYYSQRLRSILDRLTSTLDAKEITSTSLRELLRLLNEVLDRNPPIDGLPTTDLAFCIDETLLFLDEFIVLVSTQDYVEIPTWQDRLVIKMKHLILTLKPSQVDYEYYYRKIVWIALMDIIPLLESRSEYLHTVFISFQESISSADRSSLQFIESILDDIRFYLGCQQEHHRLPKWEHACRSFFGSKTTSWIDPPEITSATSDEDGLRN